MPLTCEPLAQGQILPETLEAIAYGRTQAIWFCSPKQVYLTQLHQMCWITCKWEVHRQEIRHDVHLPLVGHRWEVPQAGSTSGYMLAPD